MRNTDQQATDMGFDQETGSSESDQGFIGLILRYVAKGNVRGVLRSRLVLVSIGVLIVLVSGLLVGRQLTVTPASADTQADFQTDDIGLSSPSSDSLTLTQLPAYTLTQSNDASITRIVELHTVIPDRPRTEILKYTVEAGDSIFAIADRFGLRPETVLWGNYAILQDDPHSLRPGQELTILPVDGTYYEWSEGDGLYTVASFFGVEPEDIVYWPGNDLSLDLDFSNPEIAPGTYLIVPGGTREFVSWQAPRISRSNPAVARITGPGACGSVYDGPVGEGYFVWPTTATFLSGFSYSSFHPGIDIAGSTGNAVFASASGVVVYAGWSNYGYGYMVVIDHGDGWQTLYAHMSQVNVVCGQAVFQGGVIGGVGSTGNSTGPHLHFETQHDAYGKVNPYDLVSP